MSRIIIKNIPKNVDKNYISQKFRQFGQITDCSIRFKGSQSRRFAFVGFKHKNCAQKAKQYFNNTYFYTSKIKIQLAQTKSNQEIAKSTSKSIQPVPDQQNFNIAKDLIINKARTAWKDVLKAKQQKLKYPKNQQTRIPTPIINRKITKTKQRLLARQKKVQKQNIKKLSFIDRPLQINTKRLYIANIPFCLTDQQLKSQFQMYGSITSIKFPKNSDGKSKGYAFIQYQQQMNAVKAYSQTQNQIVFGRILHVSPALQDMGKVISHAKDLHFRQNVVANMSTQQKTSYKKKKKNQLVNNLQDQVSWNTLFLNPNTVIQYLSKSLGMQKDEVLNPENQGLAVKLALAQAEVINQVKQWMHLQGISLQFLQKSRKDCKRSVTTILVKNLLYSTNIENLRQLFSFYGQILRVKMPQNRALAIIEFVNQEHANNAFKALSYKNYKNTVLYLQWAPQGILSQKNKIQAHKKQLQQESNRQQMAKTLYIKNINFNTLQSTLLKTFSQLNPKSVKIIRDKSGKSMGYGFIQFQNKIQTQKAIRKYQGIMLDQHILQLHVSKNKKKIQQSFKKQVQLNIPPSSKLLVKNIPFQTNRGQIRQLFKSHGQVKSVRIPKKADGSHRGFCFVQFSSGSQAATAKQALQNSHLYGRKLVIQYAQDRNIQNLIDK